MKKILITIFLFMSLALQSQQVFFTYEPITNRAGGIIEYSKKVGGYIGYSYGEKKKNDYGMTQRKFVIGLSVEINDYAKALAGYNMQRTWELYDHNSCLDISKVHKHSFSIGFEINLFKRLYILTTTDPLNWQTDFGIGIKIF